MVTVSSWGRDTMRVHIDCGNWYTSLTLQSCSTESLWSLRCVVFKDGKNLGSYFVGLQSEEKLAYYSDVDPEHLNFKAGSFRSSIAKNNNTYLSLD